MNDFGSRLRLARGGMSQAELAKKLGITQRSIVNYEKSGRIPKEYIIHKICELYGINKNWLMNGIEPMYKSQDIKTADMSALLKDQQPVQQYVFIEENSKQPPGKAEKTADMSAVFELQQEIISLLKEKAELIRQNADLRFELKVRDDRIRELEDKIASLREALTKASAMERSNSGSAG